MYALKTEKYWVALKRENTHHVANIIGLCQLSPKIIHAVIKGDYPSTLTLNSLKKKLPDLWSEQEAMLLGEN